MSYQEGEGLDIRALFGKLFRRKWWIVGCTVVATIALAGAAFLMTPVYRASVILVPADPGADSGSLGSALGQLGGLASVAGLALGSRGSSTEEALAVLRSRQLTEGFIDANELTPKLFVDRWDAAKGTWKSGKEPTPARVYRFFDQRVRSVAQDKRTGLIKLTIDWTDRAEAARWANAMAEWLNEEMRTRAIRQSDASVGYLEKEMQVTSTVTTREAIGRLIEAQVKQRMLANVTHEYAFRVVDKAMPPDADDPVRPKLLLMLLGGIFGGFAFGVIGVLVADWFRPVPGPKAIG